MTDEVMEAVAAEPPLDSLASTEQNVVPMSETVEAAGCGCGAGASTASSSAAIAGAAVPSAQASRDIYAVGTVKIHFPNTGLHREFYQVLANAGIKREGKSDEELLYALLTHKPSPTDESTPTKINSEYLYIAQSVCWILLMNGMDTYQLYARLDTDFYSLVASLAPTKSEDMAVQPLPSKINLVVGSGTRLSPTPHCSRLDLPTVVLDRFLCITLKHFAKQIIAQWPSPEEAAATGVSCVGTQNPTPATLALVERLIMALLRECNNIGATDEYRALTYLVMSYPPLYHTSCLQVQANMSFPTVQPRLCPQIGHRISIELIFTYVNQSTNVPLRFVARVDATDKFPFVVDPLQPYYGMQSC